MLKKLEKEIEKRMNEMVKERGGLSYKFIGLVRGVPDRIIITPVGAVWFVELKTAKGRLSKIQSFQIKKLEKGKANVRVVYGYDGMAAFIQEVMGNGV